VVRGTRREPKMPDGDHHPDFEPDQMVEALRMAVGVLRLSGRRPDLAVIVTRKIIELARASERESERLAAAALRGDVGPRYF